MSTTIGFGWSHEVQNGSALQEITALVGNAGYGSVAGTSEIESDSREGITAISEILGWQQVLILRSPADAKANLAFGIHQELQRQLYGETPKFFGLLLAVTDCAVHHGFDFDVFFCTEWEPGYRVRAGTGDVDQLIRILSLPGHWCQLYLGANRDRVWFQEDSEEPFLYRVVTQKLQGQERFRGRRATR